MSTEKLLARVLKLPREERARLAQGVLSSLEEPQERVVAAWATELERRAADVEDGGAETFDWNAVEQEVLVELAQRRANRTAS
jgi:putative addiction module component (TIGR02574 family)